MVCVKMIMKAIMTAMLQRPPFADLNSGFSLYRKSYVVLNRSHAVTPFLIVLKNF